MAVEKFTAKQLADDYRARTLDDHGKWRIQFFEVEATTVAGDALSTIDLCELPPGAVRVLLNQSYIECSAFGAARTLDVGHRAYQPRGPGETAEAEDLDAFAQLLDVATAAVRQFDTSPIKFDVYSRTGVTVAAQVKGGTIPVGATLKGYVTYIYE